MRGRGEGSITQLADGRWQARITVDGKRRARYGKTRREAQQKLREMQREAEQGLRPEASSMTISRYLETWLRDVVRPSVRPETFTNYEKLTRLYVTPEFGRVQLSKLNATHVRALHRSIEAKGLSRSTVQRTHRVLHNALQRAVADRILMYNPASDVHPPTPPRKRHAILTLNEANTLLATTPDLGTRTLYRMALTTGLRQGELLGLRWDDVDLERGSVRVWRQLDKHKHLVELKTNSRREVAIDAVTVQSLTALRAEQQRWAQLIGPQWEYTGFVFTGMRGEPLLGTSVTGRLHRILERAGLPMHSFHDLRHTAVSQMLDKRVPIKVVQSRVGHSSAALTLDTYGHMLPATDREAAEVLGGLLSSDVASEVASNTGVEGNYSQ